MLLMNDVGGVRLSLRVAVFALRRVMTLAASLHMQVVHGVADPGDRHSPHHHRHAGDWPDRRDAHEHYLYVPCFNGVHWMDARQLVHQVPA